MDNSVKIGVGGWYKEHIPLTPRPILTRPPAAICTGGRAASSCPGARAIIGLFPAGQRT